MMYPIQKMILICLDCLKIRNIIVSVCLKIGNPILSMSRCNVSAVCPFLPMCIFRKNEKVSQGGLAQITSKYFGACEEKEPARGKIFLNFHNDQKGMEGGWGTYL